MCHWLLNLFFISVFHFSGNVYGESVVLFSILVPPFHILPCPFRWRHVLQSNRTLEIGFVGLNALCQKVFPMTLFVVFCNNQIYIWLRIIFMLKESSPSGRATAWSHAIPNDKEFCQHYHENEIAHLCFECLQLQLWPRTIC